MRAQLQLASLAIVTLWTAQAAADLYVVRVAEGGDESPALSSTSTAVFVDRFANTGNLQTPLATIALPTAASASNSPLTLAGNMTSEGFLKRSIDGRYLTLGGYAAEPGTLSVNTTASSMVPRVIGRIDVATQAVDTSTVFSGDSTFSGRNIRSAITTNGTDIWVSGDSIDATNAGVRYTTFGSNASTQLSSQPTNVRVVNIFGGQLYVSSAAGAFHGVSTVGAGLPTESGQTTTTVLPENTILNATANYDFWFKDANTFYLADDRPALLNGGIQKWVFSNNAWSLAYTIVVGSGAGDGARGLAGATVDGNAVLYATTREASANTLVTVTDTGPGSAVSILATAPANSVFRGVALVSGDFAPIDPDFNGDGLVNAADYVWWRKTGGGQDAYNAWRAAFGTGAGSARAHHAAVPEPASLALVMIAAMASLCRRRR